MAMALRQASRPRVARRRAVARRAAMEAERSALDRSSGNFALIDTLASWGITTFAGVNGGGVIHVAKYLQPLGGIAELGDGAPRLLTMSEYAAGFMPIGHYLASGRIAGCVTTTGAATKLGMSGLSDAKLLNIPAVYLVALNSTLSVGMAPLQDVSEHGMNIVAQLRAELGDGCIVIDSANRLEDRLRRAQEVLSQRRPVAIAFHPDILARPAEADVPWTVSERGPSKRDVAAFLAEFPEGMRGRRVVVYVSEEAGRSPGMRQLTTRLSCALRAPTVWSVNGANAVEPDNPYGFGHISFGGNDRAMEIWRSLGPDDVVIALGLDAGEYSLNLARIGAGALWHFTGLPEPYGHVYGDFRHRTRGEYRQVRGDIAASLAAVLPHLEREASSRPETPPAPRDLNGSKAAHQVKDDRVDLVAFYEALYSMWRPHTIGFDDVCVAYRERQYVTQRPHPNARFYAAQDGSAMGGGFGLGVGAKLARPDLHTFVFSGDGCWRLFGGALADAANLDLRVFIVNNGTYAIVDKGLELVIPEVEKRRYHSRLPHIDFVAAARAHGWDGYSVRPDLSNLAEIMDACYEQNGRSILVEIPADPDQVIGPNPRLQNLTTKTYL